MTAQVYNKKVILQAVFADSLIQVVNLVEKLSKPMFLIQFFTNETGMLADNHKRAELHCLHSRQNSAITS